MPSRFKAPEGWTIVPLKNVCVGIFDCPHSTPTLSPDGYYLVRSQDIRGGFFDRHSAAHVDRDTFLERTRRATPVLGDILYSREGTYFGIAAEVPPATPLCLGQRMVLIRPDATRISPRYLRYWLNSPQLQKIAYGFHDGSVAQRLNVATIKRLPVAFPRWESQQEIAAILGALDDKIELNREMNRTLEAMAQALFKSWFVDFDPVVAKAAGRPPVGMDSETAALFPDRFVDSRWGPKPDGWEWSSIGKEAKVVGGSTPSTREDKFWKAGNICWATPRDLSKLNDPALLDTDRKITESGLRKISSGLLPPGTVLLSSRAPIGYVAMAAVPTAINQGFIAMVCDGRLPAHYLLWWAIENVDEAVARSSGTTFAEISKRNYRPIPTLVPPPDILEAWNSIGGSIFDMVVTNLRQTAALTNLRDTLLQELLSGRIRVTEAESAVAEAV